MDEPIDRQGRIKALQEQINALKQRQKEDQTERVKAFREQAEAIKQLQNEEQLEHRKALLEQAETRRQKQQEEINERKGLLDQIYDKLDEARDEHLEEHIKQHHPDDRRKHLEFLWDHGDQEARKGFLKFHILGVLIEGPTHGYEIMHRIHHHTGHLWMPSPGSLYPALESLESKGFISCHGDGRRKVYSLTPKGEAVIGEVQKKHEEQFLEMKAFMSKLFDE